MNTKTHCPYRQTKNLQDALTSGKVKVAFLLGAGCPVSIRMKDGVFCADPGATDTTALIPDIAGLTNLVKIKLKGDDKLKISFEAVLTRLGGEAPESKITIEDILSHIRSLQDVIREGSIDGLDKTSLAALDTEICNITTTVVDVPLPQARTAYHQLATWIGGVPRANAVELFTPNYDLLLEQGLESGQIPYFDGFVGSKQAFFDLTSMEAQGEDALPDRWARLWKVHGSINWWRVAVEKQETADKGKEEFEVVRGKKPKNAVQQMIYPSHLKYDQSRRMPYLAMLDRLRSFLGRGQAVIVTCGYSFLDQHLNEVVLQGLRSNPPWDMLQMQEVEWFSERILSIATQSRAADRKRLIAELPKTNPTVWAQFKAASERADQEQFVVRKCGDFPLMAGGRTNLYQLFVERAGTLVRPTGVVALLTPSGIAADQGAAKFFQSISTTNRLSLLVDFENKGHFFPDVHDNFKFVALVFGGKERVFSNARCAFYIHDCNELDEKGRLLTLTAEDFEIVNPNTGAAPIFRSERDAQITLGLYRRHQILVRHGIASASLGRTADVKVWPVKFYQGMFNMTADSGLFLKPDELTAQGYERREMNHWEKKGNSALPLLVGKMIWHYDHRACSVTVNESSLQVATSSSLTSEAQHGNTNFFPEPQYWVKSDALQYLNGWALAFRDITNPTNERTAIAAIVPNRCAGNTLPLLLPEGADAARTAHQWIPLLLANLNGLVFDYVTRQKAKWTHLNWFILEQLPVVAPERFEQSIGGVKIADFIRMQVLALTYTAHDMGPFACDMGYVYDSGPHEGEVKPPFVWDDEDRRQRLAALDALFFHLYGLNADDAAYIMDTFPIVREHDIKAFGRYRTKDDVLTQLKQIEKGVLAVASAPPVIMLSLSQSPA